MKKKVALLIDGEWLRCRLEESLNGKLPHGVTADVMYRNAISVIESDEEIFRIFYYDCPPYDGTETNPVDGSKIFFGKQPIYQVRLRFLNELKSKDFIALRLGVCKKRGWTLTEAYTKKAIKGKHQPLAASDVRFRKEQKGVDMRIGIDVATLSLKRIVDRIILISGDIDMVPAVKLARREGIQVVVCQVGSNLAKQLDEDCDLVRKVKISP